MVFSHADLTKTWKMIHSNGTCTIEIDDVPFESSSHRDMTIGDFPATFDYQRLLTGMEDEINEIYDTFHFF